MIYKVFSIFDSKAAAYGQPFFAYNEGIAQRNVAASLDSDSLLAKFPQDYSLFVIGTFDDATGELKARSPVAVANVVSLRELRNG